MTTLRLRKLGILPVAVLGVCLMPATSRATLTIVSDNGQEARTTLKLVESTGTLGTEFHAEEASLGPVVLITLDQEGMASGTGQASVVNTGINFETIEFSFIDPYMGTQAFEVDPSFELAAGTEFTVFGFDQNGTRYSESFVIARGQNRFTVNSDSMQYISGVTITTAPDALITGIEAIRIGDIVTAPVPEPSTVAMALTGFGMHGVAGLRRLRRRACVDA